MFTPKINIAPNAKIPLFILNSCRIVLVLLLIFSSKLNNVKIMDRVDQLEDFAESGMLLSSISEVIGEERFLVCENYLIFYHTGKSVVTVDRVLYGRRDYLSVLFDKTREESLEEDSLPEE